MDSKGIEIQMLLFAFIAFFLLVIVGFFVSSSYGKGFSFIDNVFPNFGSSNNTKSSEFTFRYNLEDGDIDYLDGLSWRGFPKDEELIINDDHFVFSEVKSAVRSYYYQTKRESYLPVSGSGTVYNFYYVSSDGSVSGWQHVFYPSQNVGALKATIVGFIQVSENQKGGYSRREGDVDLLLLPDANGVSGDFGEIIVSQDGTLRFRKMGKQTFEILSSGNYPGSENLKSQVDGWKYSILDGGDDETTLDVPYKDEKGLSSFVGVSVKKLNNYLVFGEKKK